MVDAPHEEKDLWRTSRHPSLMQHIVVIGKTGQLARALVDRAAQHNIRLSSYGRKACNLSGSSETIKAFATTLPDCDGLIIAAAYTAVDAAEDDFETAQQVNGVAPGIFAQECANRAIPLVHISTDYVFPGDGHEPLKPNTPTDAINAYGKSKLAGELAVQASSARHAILRTSWVFDGTGKNFMTTMLRLAQGRDTLSVVADQIGRPTFAGHLADAAITAIKKLINTPAYKGGTYHVSGTGQPVSWAQFADAIFTQAISHIPHTMQVNYIPASEYPTPAKRPSYSVLDTASFERDFSCELPDWQQGLGEAFQDWASNPPS